MSFPTKELTRQVRHEFSSIDITINAHDIGLCIKFYIKVPGVEPMKMGDPKKRHRRLKSGAKSLDSNEGELRRSMRALLISFAIQVTTLF